jgi:hypothetical protein
LSDNNISPSTRLNIDAEATIGNLSVDENVNNAKARGVTIKVR